MAENVNKQYIVWDYDNNQRAEKDGEPSTPSGIGFFSWLQAANVGVSLDVAKLIEDNTSVKTFEPTNFPVTAAETFSKNKKVA